MKKKNFLLDDFMEVQAQVVGIAQKIYSDNIKEFEKRNLHCKIESSEFYLPFLGKRFKEYNLFERGFKGKRLHCQIRIVPLDSNEKHIIDNLEFELILYYNYIKLKRGLTGKYTADISETIEQDLRTLLADLFWEIDDSCKEEQEF